jgi:glycine/D-amino acid oxidase-like deaminating enzyme/nitrite reductase/ring-hydroxylating ferredoxin subunit
MSLPTQTHSFWRQSTPETHFPQLITDISVDVAIVGAGITGLTTALFLKRAGLKVAVIEAYKIGHGTTGYTSAHLSEVPDAGYQTLISNFGETNARLIVNSRRTAIKTIVGIVEQENIQCDFQRVPGYLYTESREDIDYLEAEVEMAQQLGVDATLTTQVPLPFPLQCGILFPHQGQFQPVQYLHGLANAIEGEGSHIFERTKVLDFTDDLPCRLYTDRGSVKAQNIILATHTPIHDIAHQPDLMLLSTKIAPYRSYILGVRLVEKRFGPTNVVPAGLFWDTVEPYHYTRTYQDEKGLLLIVGGEDHKTGQDINTNECFTRLEEYVRARYEVDEIEYKWSSQFYEPIDGIPFIGKPNIHSHLYVATGYSGNGLSFGTIAAMLLSDLVLGKANPWSQLYDPNRVVIGGAADFIKQNLDVATHFVTDRFKSDASRLSEIRPNEGKIVDIRGEKLAVYRDPQGTLHAVSPVCTHATCIVHWNSAETSWDCPCHGGRYSPTGQVLNGPPISPLQPKKIENG